MEPLRSWAQVSEAVIWRARRMPRPFLQNVGFLVLINLLIKPVFIFGIDLAVQNRVGPAAYGFYFALFNFAFLFNVLLDFGIQNFNQRLVARDPSRVKAWLPNIIWVKLLLSLAFYAAIFLVALGLRFEPDQLRLLAWIALNRVLISFHMYFRSNVSGLQAFRTDAVLSVLDRSLTILLVGALLYTDVLGRPFTVRDFVLATTVSFVLTTLGSLAAMLRLTGPIKPQFNRRLFGLVVQRAYPFALLGVLMTIYNRVDGVMLERLLGEQGDYQAGVYAAAYRLLDAGTMFAFLIAGILLPLFARMRKTGEDVWPVAQSSWRLLLAVSLTASVVSVFNAAPLMDALYTESTPFWGRTFAWLMPGFVFNATVYVFGSLLTAENRLRGLNAIALLGVAGNVVLNLIFIPRWQALGAAYATLITQGIVAVAHIIYAARVYGWSGRLSAEAARGLGFTAAIMAMAWGLAQLLPDWRMHFLATAVLAALLAWGFGLLNPRAILSARASSRRGAGPDEDEPNEP